MQTYRMPVPAMAVAAGLSLLLLAGCGSSSTASAQPAGTASAPAQVPTGPSIALTTTNWCSVIPTSLSEQTFSPTIGTTVACSGNGTSAQWDGQASPDLVVSIQEVNASNAQMLSNAYFAGQGDPVQTATEHGYSIRDVNYDGIAYADLTLGAGTYLEVVVQANTVQELPADAAASAAQFALSAVGLLKAGG